MIQCNVQNPNAANSSGPIRQAYTHFGGFSDLLDFIAPMKNAKDAAFPTITAAAICNMATEFIPGSYPTQEGMQ